MGIVASVHLVSVVLVGPAGVGKSSVGRLVAKQLGVNHIDTDEMISRQSGLSVVEIFDKLGEFEFRKLESAALEAALAEKGAVISTGGGVALSPSNQENLKDSPALVVWLDAQIEALAKRIGDGKGRPLLGNEEDLMSELRANVAKRNPGFEEVADVRIETSKLTLKQTCEAVANEYRVLQNLTAQKGAQL